MEFAFYLCGLVAVLTTLRVIIHTNPVHALIYLIISILAIAGVFFSLGAYFVGALETIIYAGAIMVLFVFIVMMMNLDKPVNNQKKWHLQHLIWICPGFMIALLLLMIMLYAIMDANNDGMDGSVIYAKAIGISLFGPYILAVELVSMLLLASLVVVSHIISYDDRYYKIITSKHFIVDAASEQNKRRYI